MLLTVSAESRENNKGPDNAAPAGGGVAGGATDGDAGALTCACVFRKSSGKRIMSDMIPVEAPAARATTAAQPHTEKSMPRPLKQQTYAAAYLNVLATLTP